MDVQEAKRRVCDEVDRRRDVLLDVSHRIHADPELAFAEHAAHDLLTEVLRHEGFDVTAGAYGLPTAFEATAGRDGPRVAVLCEYDALPGIGHACGHNIIAAAGLGAGLAAAVLADDAGGRLVVLGSPAEEGGGGKVNLIDGGAFDGVDAAVMVHPAGRDLRRMHAIAIHQVLVSYEGAAAHAAAAPYEGRNALDAAVLGYNNLAALRQHLRPDERVHGIITDGGDRPNIVPAHAAAHWYVRAGTRDRLAALEERVLACLQAGADAAGCTMDAVWLDPAYDEMRDNEALTDLYAANAAMVGRTVAEPTPATAVTGSTDMGNVSQVVASIHPMIAVSPPDVAIHTPAFAGFAGGPEGDRAVLDGAKAMAMTVVDLWLDVAALDRVRGGFVPPC